MLSTNCCLTAGFMACFYAKEDITDIPIYIII